jgi:hypothetical protein
MINIRIAVSLRLSTVGGDVGTNSYDSMTKK